MTRLAPAFLRVLRFTSTVMARTKCFLDMAIDDKPAGRIVIEVSAHSRGAIDLILVWNA